MIKKLYAKIFKLADRNIVKKRLSSGLKTPSYLKEELDIVYGGDSERNRVDIYYLKKERLLKMKAITDTDFDSEVLNAKGVVLVDFWAEWCGPCRQMLPILEEISKEMGDKVKICKVNVDESPDKAAELGIRSIPSIFLYKDGKQVDVKVGLNPKSAMVSWIESNL